MKILVVCQYYFPEPFRISDLCEEMVKRGHEVEVVTGEPNYPEGIIYEGYENHRRQEEIINGVIVHRCPIIPRKTGALFRILNYVSFSEKAKEYVKKMTTSDGESFDVVFVNQLSPVMMAEPAVAFKKRFGIPVVLYCLDLWPESLVAGGVSRQSVAFRIFHAISKRIYRSVDRILVTSRMFRQYLTDEFKIEDSKIEYLPQYAEGLFDAMPPKRNVDVTDLVFAGNIGEVQSVETVIKAADIMKDEPVHFHIVGGGTDLDRLKEMAEGFNNVTFYGRHPLEDMPGFYAKADAMLVTLKADPVLSLTLPGKVQSYMAAGKPIIGSINGETAEIIKEAHCGYCGEAENVDELVEAICKFINDEQKERLGYNARAFYEKNFLRSMFMDKIETELRMMETYN